MNVERFQYFSLLGTYVTVISPIDCSHYKKRAVAEELIIITLLTTIPLSC